MDPLRYYFENTVRSGGGNIDEITMETGDDDTIHVTFCDAKGRYYFFEYQLKVMLTVFVIRTEPQ